MQKEINMVKLIIFDFDGVIIKGSNEGYFTCYHKALDAVGVLLDPLEEKKKILKMWGKGYKHQLEYLLEGHTDLLQKAIKVYETCYYSPIFSKNITLIEGVNVALHKLAKKYMLAIASGMMRKTLNKFLLEFRLKDIFQEIATSDEIENPEDKKPSPYMLNKLIERFSIEKNCAVYIGDAENDVVMAKAASIKPIVVLTGHLNKKEAKKLEIQHIIPDLIYLEKVLLRL